MLRWHESLGGPFILVATDRVAAWRTDADDDGDDSHADYQAVCAVHDDVGMVERPGAGAILVLGRRKHPTAKIIVDGVDAFVQLQWARDAEDAARVIDGLTLATLPAAHEQVTLDVGPAGVTLFDSSYGGTQVEDRLDVPLAAGTYRVTAHTVEPDDETSMLVVLLRR